MTLGNQAEQAVKYQCIAFTMGTSAAALVSVANMRKRKATDDASDAGVK